MWPIERREELAELESLVADCAKLNHTTRAIDMLARITERADALLRADIVNGRGSFVAFLRSLAVSERDSARQATDGRKALAERLREHAACHESIEDNSDEQAEWMRDLHEAARLIDAAATR